MKFLIDEDVPVKLLKYLSSKDFDSIRVKPGSSDPDVARQAKNDNRILITLDKDFANTAMYPPAEFNIVQIRIHPPFADILIEAFQKLLVSIPSNEFKNLIVLQAGGHVRIS